jgi:predicted TPR repeat methyltransferase
MSFLVPEEATEAELRARLAERPDCRRSRLALAARVPDAEAGEHFRAVLDLHPDDPEALIGLAGLMVRAGELPAAIDHAQRLLRRTPDSPPAHRLLAEAWERLFDRDRAATHWRRCLEIEPEDEAARDALARHAKAPATLPADYVRCLFDQFSKDYDERMRGKLAYTGPELLLGLLWRDGAPAAGSLDILDLGCGTGLAGDLLRPIARHLEGWDLSPGMIAKARATGKYDALSVGDLHEALDRSAAWDLIVAVDVLVYLGDLAPLLTGVRRSLRPGAVFAAITEESSGPDVELKATRRFGHSRRAVERLASEMGLEVLFIEGCSHRAEKGLPLPALAFALKAPASLPPDVVRGIFDDFAETYDDHMRRRLRYRGPERVKEALEKTGGLPPAGLNVLDLGCGTGLMGEVLRPFARRLDGVDLSPAMIDKARERGGYDGLRVADMLAALAEEKEESRDLAVATDALVYLGDLDEVFRAVARALKPGGRFAGTVEESTGPAVELQPTRRFRHGRDHLAARARSAGLDPIFLESTSYREENMVPVPSLVFVATKPAR